MQLVRAVAGRRLWGLFCMAVTLFGVLGVITVARADGATTATATTEREGAMTERLRDCVTFERIQGEAFVVNPRSR